MDEKDLKNGMKQKEHGFKCSFFIFIFRRNAPPPAPETVIDSLPKRKLTEEEIGKLESLL